MGFIFKFILIAIVISWIFSKLLQFFIRSKVRQFAEHAQTLKREEEMRRRSRDSDIHVDHVPRDFQEKRTKEIKGGDYIDYEEVKD
jgi:hypothetical protein